MPSYSYYTIESPAEGIYKEKGSKFLAFACPVTSEIEIKEKIDSLKKEYFDARHHCFAWMLGPEKTRFRSFDDGEPNHSAGDPILGKIRSAGITDVLVVVVRYFGGVKLGVGGLVSAYKAAADDALNKARIVERHVTEEMSISFDYEAISDIMRLLKEFDLKVTGQEFGERNHINVSVPLQQKEKLIPRLEVIKAMKKFTDWQFKT